MTYDLLLKNGRIIDGSGMSSYRGDVAVRKGKIVEMGTVANKHGRDAVVGRKGAQGIPGDLGVVVAVVVHETRRNDHAIDVDGAVCRAP